MEYYIENRNGTINVFNVLIKLTTKTIVIIPPGLTDNVLWCICLFIFKLKYQSVCYIHGFGRVEISYSIDGGPSPPPVVAEIVMLDTRILGDKLDIVE